MKNKSEKCSFLLLSKKIEAKSYQGLFANKLNTRAEMKTLRKTLRSECGLSISIEQIKLLLKFLEIDFSKIE